MYFFTKKFFYEKFIIQYYKSPLHRDDIFALACQGWIYFFKLKTILFDISEEMERERDINMLKREEFSRVERESPRTHNSIKLIKSTYQEEIFRRHVLRYHVHRLATHMCGWAAHHKEFLSFVQNKFFIGVYNLIM